MLKPRVQQKIFNRGVGLTTAYTLLVLPIIANAQISYTLKNRIGVDSIEELLLVLLDVFMVIAIPIIVLFIIYAGFMYVTARGNAEQIQQATRALTYAVIGGVLVVGAVALSEILANLVESFSRE